MKIEIFSDLVCPWCFIGKRRLDEALRGPAGEGVEVRWRAWQLHPDLPPEGMLRSDFSRLRYGDVGKSRGGGTPGALVEQGREVGLDFDFARIPRMPNTFAGHRLLHFAAQTSANWRDQHALAEVLFSYHFCEQRDVGSHADLILAAAEAGLDTELAAACLETDAGAKAVQADLTRGRDYGVSGIPYLVFAGWFGLPGAQDSRTIGHFLQRARARVPHAG